MVTEVWRDIPEIPGYQASSLGRIRSVDRLVTTKRGHVRRLKGKILSPGVHSTSHPYPVYNLQIPGKPRRMYPAHRLVAWAFIGPQSVGQYVCHIDGDESNNAPNNLRYGTPKSNQADRIRHGTDCRGEKSGTAKLTADQVSAIRLRLDIGERQQDLAYEFGVTQSQISHIKNEKQWNA